jgi:hypothetical protein
MTSPTLVRPNAPGNVACREADLHLSSSIIKHEVDPRKRLPLRLLRLRLKSKRPENSVRMSCFAWYRDAIPGAHE